MRELGLKGRRTSWLTVAASLSIGWATEAKASCIAEPPAVVWSYPEDGATNIPTNTTIWLYLSEIELGLMEAPKLNGVPLQAGTLPYSYATPELTPNTDYVIQISLPVLLDGGDGEGVIQLAFRTGSQQIADQPASIAVRRARTIGSGSNMDGFYYPDGGALACEDLFDAHDCFDTGNANVVRLDTSASPLGWLFEVDYEWENVDPQHGPRIHPARCGSPLVPVDAKSEDYCIDLRAIFPGGIASEPTRYCSLQPLPDASFDGAVSNPPAEGGVPDASNPPEGAPDASKEDAAPGESPSSGDAGSTPHDASAENPGVSDGGNMADASTAKPDKRSKDSGCNVSAVSGNGNATAAALLLVSWVAWLRKRTRRRVYWGANELPSAN